MSSRARIATVAGIAVVGAHVAGFVALGPELRGTDLVVEVTSPLASPTLTLDGTVPPEIASRVKTSFEASDATGPGLVRKTWSVAYRGGFERRVGATQLVGPFQDPDARDCVGRIVVGQKLLDDGTAGPGTIAGEMRAQVHAAMDGITIWGLGDYTKVGAISLRWATLDKNPMDQYLVGAAPHGYVRAEARLVFERVEIPLTVALVPRPSRTALEFKVIARAQLDFDNRVVQWASDKLGADKLATKFANREIDRSLITTLAPPPPFELPDGQVITFGYCAGSPQIVDGVSGALPFSVAIGRVPGQPAILPPKRGPASHAAFDPDSQLGIDLDLDALNALLYELWRSGFLDRRLAEAGLDRRFNADPIVTEFLSLRISSLALALPPVLRPHGRGLRMSAEARVAIADGTTTTTGRVWGGLDFQFGGALEPVSVDLGALELSCERSATTLVPCFADLVGALRDRGDDFHGELTTTLAGLLADIFVERRLGASGFPADLVIHRARPTVVTTSTNAALHFDLAAQLVPAQ